jgi:formate hydrogenlyase transcriptional activator
MDDVERSPAINSDDDQRSTDQLARERDRLKLLLEINNAVVSHLGINELIHSISEGLKRVVPHDMSGISLYDSAAGVLRAHVLEYHDALPNFARGTPIPMEGSPAGLAFTTGQPVFVDRPDLERFYSDYSRKAFETGVRSGGSIPLIAHGRKLGTLGIASMRDNAFSKEDIELLCQIANQIAFAVENSLNYEQARKAERDLAHSLDELNLLLGVANSVTSNLDLREVFKAIVECLRKVIKCDGMVMTILDRDARELRVFALDPNATILPPFSEGQRVPFAGTPAERAIGSLKTVIVTREELQSSTSPLVKQISALGIQTGCIAPLVSHGKALGTLAMVSLQESAFSQDDAELLSQIAKQIAIAVENALNFERAREAEKEAARERERIELLLEINNRIASNLELRDLFISISGCLRNILHHDYADLSFYDPETDRMRVYAIDNASNIKFGQEDVWASLENTPPGLAIHTRKTVMRERPNLDEFPSESMRRALEEGIQSGCTVPLISRDRVLGVLTLASRRESAFTADDVELLTQVGVQVALAVQNALNFEAVRMAEQQISRDRDRLNLLLNVNNAIVSHLDLRELMRVISSYLKDAFRHDLVGLALYEAETNQLRTYMYDQPDDQPFVEEGQPVPLVGSMAGQAFTSGKPVFKNQIDEEFQAGINKRIRAAGFKSGGCIPLIAHGKKLGTLGVGSFEEDVFSDDEVGLLCQIANQIALVLENAIAFREIETLKNKLSEEKLYLEEEINTASDFEQIIGSSPALKRILKQVETVAPTDSTVLIQGETGTGNEMIARAIHSLSARRERTMVKINCAAIPMGLIESELFGHEKGAFTGAIAQRVGRFELANKGTLFMDEVGEIPQALQPKLLRVLQEREFERLGSTRTISVDVRLIAATNRNLEQMVSEKQYRDDLYYRLNVFPITIPPLRERQEDIPLLVRFFTSKFARRMKKRIGTIPAPAVTALQQYHWPGNIRELENVIERAVILSSGTELQIPLHEMKLQTKAATGSPEHSSAKAENAGSEPGSLEAVEREHILRVLRETDWVVSGPKGAAATLGLKRTTLQARMKKLGITRHDTSA